MIQSNLYGYLAILLEGREQFEEEILLENRRRQIAEGSSSSGTIIVIYSVCIFTKFFFLYSLRIFLLIKIIILTLFDITIYSL